MRIFNPKLCLFLLSFFLGVAALLAQEETSSQESKLRRLLIENPENFSAYYDLSEMFVATDSSEALQNVRTGLAKALQQGNQYGIGRGHFLLGSFMADYNRPFAAEEYFKKADTILSQLIQKDSSERNLKLWVRANFNIGVARSMRGINEDIYYLNKITPAAEKIGFYEILAKANSNLGITFYNAGQLPKAYAYFELGAPQHRAADDLESYATNRLLFSSCLLQMDSTDRAQRELLDIKPVLDSLEVKEKFQLYHTIQSEYHIKREEYQEAIFNLEKAEAYLLENPVQLNRLPLYMTFMKVYRAKEEPRNALKYAEKCLEISRLYQNKVIEAELYKELAYFQSELGQDRAALESLSTYVVISDSLNIAELEKEVNRLESQFQNEKREREILQLTNNTNKVELQLAKEKSQNYFLLLISVALLGLAALAFLGYRHFKKRDRLKSMEINQLKHEQETRVYSAMIEGQENERKRLAIDLHDGLAGRLSATRIKLEKLAQKSKSSAVRTEFELAAGSIDQSLTELRGIAMNMMPETLFRYGLKNAIEDYCSAINMGENEVRFILQFYDAGEHLPANVSLTIYRIIQELINNAIKHAQATEVLVQYIVENGKIDITVEDNGSGFSTEEVGEKNGMGLNNLRARVAYLEGEIDFLSAPGEGTTVHIVIENKQAE